VERLPLRFAPGLYGHAYTIDADVEIPTDGAEGVIVADGGILGGFSLFVKDSHLYYEVNVANDHSEQIVSKTPIHAGVAHIQLNVTPSPDSTPNTSGAPGFYSRRPVPGAVKLTVNGASVGEAQFSSIYAGGETLEVGSDLGSPVSPEYKSPYRFTGKINTVTFELQ
jgi:arylsulfatase